jgi:hypothetical protein
MENENVVVVPSQAWIPIITQAIQRGKEFKVLHTKLTELFNDRLKNNIVRLKNELFCVKQGSAGRTVNVSTDPKMALNFTWEGFCGYAFGVTSRRINQLLDIKDVDATTRQHENHGGGDSNKPYDPVVKMRKSELDASLKTQFDKGVEAAGLKPEEVVAKLEAAEDSYESERFDEAYKQGLAEAISNKEPYVYFEQFKEEPQTMGAEIAAMLVEFGLDSTQIREVLRYAEKDAKHTLDQTASAVGV